MANFAFMPPLTVAKLELLCANMSAQVIAVSDPITKVQPEPAKLYCPAHGRISTHAEQHNGKFFCPVCIAAALERIGVHQLTEKQTEVKKGW